LLCGVGGWAGAQPPPPRGGRRLPHLRRQPRVSFGTGRRCVTHNRTVARLPAAWTRQVTVTNLICGVDVSADTLDARLGRDGAWRRFANTSEGVAALATFCRQHNVSLVAMEATGGYEQRPFGLLWADAVECAIVNPRSVRRFAEAMGVLEKTDRIDAGMIAWYAEVKRITAQPPAGPTQRKLTALVTRLRQLTDSQTRERNQRRLVDDPEVLDSFTQVLAVIAARIRELERRIADMIAADPLWRALDVAFREIKGVADRTVARLLADLPEIGTLSGKAAAKLVGYAPIAKDSGKSNGKRPVRGGREPIRSVLFIVAAVARRHNVDFAAFGERLNVAGKPPKVIRTALAHKLLTRLNAKARDVRRQLDTLPGSAGSPPHR
jgi:transposase